jgi:thiamine pyrophosphate-dependent acetolactate synthase large subunit-like protein
VHVLVAEMVGRALAELGATHSFGLVGSGNFAVTSSLVECGVEFIAARHECGAVAMADGYARCSGEVGVATVHQGPGLTNAVTAVAEAAKARTPLILVAADTPAAAVHSNFRIDQRGLAAAVGAVPERINSPSSAAADVARAWRTAAQERRTVVLNLPLDVQTMQWSGDFIAPQPAPSPPGPSPAAVSALADLIQGARRPVVIAGRGAVRSGARAGLERLADQVGALLATSANGNGLFAGNPWSLGISGGFASPAAARLLEEADLVLSFGASLNMWTTRHGSLIAAGTKVVQVDIDEEVIGAHVSIDAGMVSDAATAAEALIEELRRRGFEGRGFRSDEMAAKVAGGRWKDEPFDDASSDDRVDPRALTTALDDVLPHERIVAIDSGHFMGWPAMYLSVPDPAGFVFAQSFQSVGLGLATSIGAAVSRPDRVTVACLGDGGALMAAGEFETVVRLGLPIVIVVYNDAAYGAEVHHFRPQGVALQTVRFPDADLAGLARGLGAEAHRVSSVEDLRALERWLLDPSAPLVLDAKVTPGVVAEWLEDAFRAH